MNNNNRFNYNKSYMNMNKNFKFNKVNMNNSYKNQKQRVD